MQELSYLEIPTPATQAVCDWLQTRFQPSHGTKTAAASGCRIQDALGRELAVSVWSLQRTTYLKVFRWSAQPLISERSVLDQLERQIRETFPYCPPQLPTVDLEQQSIFEALAGTYPETVRQFQKMPNGEYALKRAYWWEQRWRQGILNPKTPTPVVFNHRTADEFPDTPAYDLIYLGGALGVIHAAVMARLGYRVLLVERMPFGRMNREWNISRNEFQSLLDLGLFTQAEFETLIASEYRDGFNKFFDGNNPEHLKSSVLRTPTVLNIALESERLLQLCGEKLLRAGGTIWDETEFQRADVTPTGVTCTLTKLTDGESCQVTGRLLVDAMGTASPIAWQLNGGRSYDSVCPTVGAVLKGIDAEVWDPQYGDVLNSHGDISRGRQLIWELFPTGDNDLTVYLFHYHQVHPENPGSLLEMYEDFFNILPEYRRCDLDELTWVKPTFGYIPGHFSQDSCDRKVAHDRLVAMGDAASLQSPLIFTGFGSLVRNLPRLTDMLDTALRHDLLTAQHLEQIRAYQSNTAVTWLFSRGMMVPMGQVLPPQRINAMLNTFFEILAQESPESAETFIKDRFSWGALNRMALKAAAMNPMLLVWIWGVVGPRDFWRWLGSYWNFTVASLWHALLGRWVPALVRWCQPWVEQRYPGVWLWLLARSYALTYSVGHPRIERALRPEAVSPDVPPPVVATLRSH